jgi:hypothetical protein
MQSLLGNPSRRALSRAFLASPLLALLASAPSAHSQDVLLDGTDQRCTSWDTVRIDGPDILLSNNTWGSDKLRSDQWRQCIHASGTGGQARLPVGWSYDWLASTDGEQSAVKAYPEVIYGNKHGIEISADKATTGLPERLDRLPQLTVEYAYRETGSANREINVAAESFIHESCDIMGPGNSAGDNRVYEMMVWVQAGDKYPYRQPLTMAVIQDQLWYVFADASRSTGYIAFVLAETQTSGSLDWNAFLDWTRQNAPLIGLKPFQPHWCIGAVEFGSEIWWGRGEFVLDRFAVRVNGR